MIRQKTVSDWKYIVATDEEDKLEFDVIPDKKIVKPATLFKYFPLSDYAIDGLRHGYLYASHPDQFNDLYDCFHELINCPTSKDYFLGLMDGYFGSKEHRERYELNSNQYCSSFGLWLRAIIYRYFGLVSMTDTNRDVLMWSLYTDNKGFAIEFDYSAFPFRFHGPFPMNYSHNFEKVSIQNDFDRNVFVLYMSTIKNEVWRYENEWRLIIEAPRNQQMFSPKIHALKEMGGHDRKFSYPIPAIKSVSLGNHFFEPEEVYEETDNSLTINLMGDSENFDKKRIVLAYLLANSIPIKIIRRVTENNKFDLTFNEGHLERIEDNKYRFI